MGAALEAKFAGIEVDLIRGGRGDFIVTVDGRELWNKRSMNDEFPKSAEIVRRIESAS